MIAIRRARPHPESAVAVPSNSGAVTFTMAMLTRNCLIVADRFMREAGGAIAPRARDGDPYLGIMIRRCSISRPPDEKAIRLVRLWRRLRSGRPCRLQRWRCLRLGHDGDRHFIMDVRAAADRLPRLRQINPG